MSQQTTFKIQPRGEFDLLYQNQFFNGWPLLSDQMTIVMAFPVEGWQESAAVTLKQNDDKSVAVTVYGSKNIAEKARDQALSALSLDEDGSGWHQVGNRDTTLKHLQEKYHYIRPSMFHSPYEATAHFMIGHRISMVQGRKIRERISQEFGEKFMIDGQTFYAFPAPQVLLTLNDFAGLNQTKIDRLHAMAQAALDGWLDRKTLRQMDEGAALTKLETLPGVGSFFSQGILDRGAGRADGMTHDDLTYHAIGLRYNLDDKPTKDQVLKIAENWHPYRMWAIVLHHIWLRESGNMPKRTFSKR